MRLVGLRPLQDAPAGAGGPHRGGPRPRCYHPGPGLGRSARLPRLPGPSPRRPRPSDRLPRPGRHRSRLMAMTQLRAAANADAARWLLPADVDWWDLVRYRPPGFDVYVRIALAQDGRGVDPAGEQPALRIALATLASYT